MSRTAYWLLMLLMNDVFVLEIARGDGWRSLGMGIVTILLLSVRRELLSEST